MSAGKLLPRRHDEFRSKHYWDDFFRKRTDAFEWYGEYQDLRKLVHRTIRRTDRVLVIGCGNSNFSAELYDDGFEEIENVDFSQPVVAEMCRAHSGVRPRMTWRVMDVTDMSGYEKDFFDVVVDKGTLDALMSEDTEEVKESGTAMLKEVERVLRPGGRYLCVTLWQDFIGSLYLAYFARGSCISGENTEGNADWTIDLHSAAATASKPSPYLPLCVIATKIPSTDVGRSQSKREGSSSRSSSSSSRIGGACEETNGVRVAAWCDRAGRAVDSDGDAVLLRSEQEVLTHVRDAQQMHRRRFDLRDIRPGRFEQEDLWGDQDLDSPRFTFLIVDVPDDGKPGVTPCAVVLIPRGRDRDFTFSSQEGLQQVAQSASARRVIAARLNRGHDFSGGVEGVKAEISTVVSEFAPDASSASGTGGLGIPIMAVGDSLGMEGRVVAQGHLECSGKFVVEEEEEDEDDEGRPAGVYRRLIFLKNQGVEQTEVRLLGEDEEDGTGASARKKSSSKSGGGKKGKGKGKGGKGKRPSAGPGASTGGGRGSDEVAERSGNAAAPEQAEGDGEDRVRVDFGHLCFEYHRCMAAGAAFGDLRPLETANGAYDPKNRSPTALVIGLGGGALPMALRRLYPSLHVVAVELDPGMAGVAKKFFGLRESHDGLKVVVDDGIAFVNTTAATAVGVAADPDAANGRNGTSELELAFDGPVEPAVSNGGTGTDTGDVASLSPPPPPEDHSASPRPSVGWGEAFGPPYSAIFVDVDSKDTTVGMSCPPAAFLEPAFLENLKALLQPSGGAACRGPGVLAINVAARSRELFRGALEGVCAAFSDGEVHKLRAGSDDVNSVLLALPRPRPRSRSGSLRSLAEQAFAAARVKKRALGNILDACERAEPVHLGCTVNKGTTSQAKQRSKTSRKRGGR